MWGGATLGREKAPKKISRARNCLKKRGQVYNGRGLDPKKNMITVRRIIIRAMLLLAVSLITDI